MKPDPRETLVPEGEYRVVYTGCESGFPYGQEKWFVHFQITQEGASHGLPLLRFYNAPRGPHLPRSHNMWLDYIRLIERKPPRNLKPKDFLQGCEVSARIVTVGRIQEGKEWKKTPAEVHYSKIDALLKITAGWPPGVSRPFGWKPEPDLEPECEREPAPHPYRERESDQDLQPVLDLKAEPEPEPEPEPERQQEQQR